MPVANGLAPHLDQGIVQTDPEVIADRLRASYSRIMKRVDMVLTCEGLQISVAHHRYPGLRQRDARLASRVDDGIVKPPVCSMRGHK